MTSHRAADSVSKPTWQSGRVFPRDKRRRVLRRGSVACAQAACSFGRVR